MVDELSAALAQDLLPRPLRVYDRYSSSAYTPKANTACHSLYSQLTTHDRLTRHSTFFSESFACGICLETKKGARCTRLQNCGHVFCVECLYSFFELNIREGLVRNVSCADLECVKGRQKGDERKGLIGEEEMENIVGTELTERYKWLIEKQRIESGTCKGLSQIGSS